MSFEMYNIGKPLNDNTDLILSSWGVKSAPKAGYANSALSKKIDKDTVQIQKNSADGLDDGKISFKEKVKNFGKGIVAPFKAMVSSPKNIAITVASAAAAAGLIAVTGGAAAPVLVAAGLIGGGVQIGKGIYKQATAKTDAQAASAWQDMGSGTVTVGLSAAGAKSSLKAAKVVNADAAKNMSVLKASMECIKSAPKQIGKSWTNASGKLTGFWTSLGKGKTPETGELTPVPTDTPETAPPAKKNLKVNKNLKGKFKRKPNASETVETPGEKPVAKKSIKDTTEGAPIETTAPEAPKGAPKGVEVEVPTGTEGTPAKPTAAKATKGTPKGVEADVPTGTEGTPIETTAVETPKAAPKTDPKGVDADGITGTDVLPDEIAIETSQAEGIDSSPKKSGLFSKMFDGIKNLTNPFFGWGK